MGKDLYSYYSWELEGRKIVITDEDLLAEIGPGPFEIVDTEHDCSPGGCLDWLTAIKNIATGEVITREICYDYFELVEENAQED